MAQDGHRDALAGELRFSFAGDPAAVRRALSHVMVRLHGALEDPIDRATVEIVLAEVLNNVAEHAYGGGGGRIELWLRWSADGLGCVVLDDGRPMPGGRLPTGAPPRLADDLPEGGFGWQLIRRLARDLCYCRSGGRNRLSFSLPLGQAADAALSRGAKRCHANSAICSKRRPILPQ